MIDTIYFDNWNTLVQAPGLMRVGGSTEIFHKYLINNGIRIDYDEFLSVYIPIARKQRLEADADGYRELNYRYRLEMVFKEIHINDPIEMSHGAWEVYLAEWPKQTTFFPETPNILDELNGNYKLGVITNYMDGPTCRRVFDKLGYEGIFESLVVSAELGYRKPSKLLFETALKDTNSSPKSSLMVGDTFNADIVGANNVGMKNVLIDLYNSQQEHYHDATEVIHNIGQFPKALQKIQKKCERANS
jgi:putative hydrolase of the HAD superfamily